jgi:methyltransferase-like protein/SAM-dependent methyltransferase
MSSPFATMDKLSSSYDDIPYPGHAYPQTHPDRLATLARLFGMNPAPADQCRVLELGCGNGSNLIPMALTSPNSRFLGIDLASKPIASGNDLIGELALQNVELRQQDLTEFDSAEPYDYIIAHGLYSWVPPAVQKNVLDIIASNLGPHGVAFVSYNAHPGGHVRSMLREMMRFHVREIPDPAQKISQARAFMGFLLGARLEEDPYRMLLKKEAERVLTYPEGHLYHDDLGETNRFFYFHEFMKDASSHGLQYLAEADFSEMQPSGMPDDVVENLSRLCDDIILYEQYLDFLKCRRFRQTLLCRSSVPLNRRLSGESIAGFYIASLARPKSRMPDVHAVSMETYESPDGVTFETDHPLAKAALTLLAKVWPAYIPFEQLLTAAQESCSPSPRQSDSSPEERQLLANFLFRLYSAGLLELHTQPPQFTTHVSTYPKASPLARIQIRTSAFVTSLRHRTVKIDDPIAKSLLQLLDGTSDLKSLQQGVANSLQGNLPPEQAAAIMPRLTGTNLDEALRSLAGLALLIA